MGVIALVESRSDSVYKTGIADSNLLVRKQAIEAACWGRQAWLLPHLRKLANRPEAHDFDAVQLLAVLGEVADLPDLRQAGISKVFGPRRFQILGAYGHPAAMDLILAGLESKDVPTALAAGAAYFKMTGFDIESNEKVVLPPDDGHEPDDFEKEFLDVVALPSAAKAKGHWQQVKDDYARGIRWCRGHDLGRPLSDRDWEKIDLESRWEDALRRRFAGIDGPNWLDLERFPQVKPAPP